MYDGGTLLRKLCFILAENSRTPIPYWLDLPLWELVLWVETNNDLIKARSKN